MPPKELLRRKQDEAKKSPRFADNSANVAGDSFGSMETRKMFWEPCARLELPGIFGELFPKDAHPEDCINPDVVLRFCSRFGLETREAVRLLLDARCDINVATRAVESRGLGCAAAGRGIPAGSYALVALEKYSPECFCIVEFTVPSFEATRDEAVLEALHEITLSAAEIPLDTPAKDVVDVLSKEWDVEDGTPVEQILKDYDLSVARVSLLPFGDYSCQGFHVMHPLNEEGFPNIGVAAGACLLDLRTGIHNKFRFDLERLCDTLIEHVNYERVHFGQNAHLLRQPYWWNPEYSVEELIRFKENVQKPSASIFEMRYMNVHCSGFGLKPFRNVVELDRLRVKQHQYEKDVTEQIEGESKLSSGGVMRTVGLASGAVHRYEDDLDKISNHLATGRKIANKYGVSAKQNVREIEAFYQNRHF